MPFPIMSSYELMTGFSGERDTLESPANKRIAIYGFMFQQHVTASAAVTAEAKLFFGADDNDKHKRLASFTEETAGEEAGITISGLNVIGLIGEPVTLENATYAPGSIQTDCILFYGFI